MQKARSMTHPDQYLLTMARILNMHTTLWQITSVITNTPGGTAEDTQRVLPAGTALTISITERWFCHSTVSPAPPLRKSIYLNHPKPGSFMQVFSSDSLNSSAVTKAE